MGGEQFFPADGKKARKKQHEAQAQAEGKEQAEGEEELSGLMQAAEYQQDSRGAGQQAAGDSEAKQLPGTAFLLLGLRAVFPGFPGLPSRTAGEEHQPNGGEQDS